MARRFRSLLLLGCILALSLPACKGGSKVSLLAAVSTLNVVPVTTQTSLNCPPPLPASVSDTRNIGDGASSDWPDRFLTPTTFAVGIKSASLLQTTDTINPITFGIFDRGSPNAPLPIYLDSATPQTISDSSSHLPDGTYSSIQYEVVYYEMIIPVFNGGPGDTAPHCRRVRLYLADSADPFTLNGTPVSAFDILLSSSDNGLDFNWISTGGVVGPTCPLGQAGCLVPTRPANPYQLPPNRRPNVTGAQNIVIQNLSPPIVADKNSKDFAITLTFDVSNLFFFDETDTDASNPNSLKTIFTDNFNFLASRPPLNSVPSQTGNDQSRDGSLLNACTPIPGCTISGTNSADFWPVPPLVTASVVAS